MGHVALQAGYRGQQVCFLSPAPFHTFVKHRDCAVPWVLIILLGLKTSFISETPEVQGGLVRTGNIVCFVGMLSPLDASP